MINPIIRNPLLALLLAGSSAGCVSNRLTELGDSLEPLRAHFNAQRGKPRIIGFFSPT